MKRSDVLRVALAGTAFACCAAAAHASDAVRVRVPQGVTYADSTTSDAPGGDAYVTVTGLVFPNPTSFPQSYRVADVHLLARGNVYAPVVRPHLGAIDAIDPGIVGPHEALRLSVTFRVPAGVSTADLEFTPHWIDDSGRTVDYCCYYL